MADTTQETRRKHAEWMRGYRAGNKEALSKRVAERRAEVKAYIDLVKSTTPCADCATTYPAYVMEYDHLQGKNHKKYVTSGVLTISGFLKDVKQCELVCANCHKIRTYTRRGQ